MKKIRIALWSLVPCAMVTYSMDINQKKYEQALRARKMYQKFAQQMQSYDKNIFHEKFQKLDDKRQSECLDRLEKISLIDGSLIKNFNNSVKVQESSNWSFSTLNPFHLFGYFYRSKQDNVTKQHNFDWENPYVVSYEESSKFYTGYKNFIEEGKNPNYLHDIALRKKVFTGGWYFDTEDNNSCFYCVVEDGRGGYKAEIYDAKQDKRIGASCEKDSFLHAFDSNNIGFITRFNDGEFITIINIRSVPSFKVLKRDGYRVSLHAVTQDGLVVVFKKDTEEIMVFYDVKDNYREIKEITTDKSFKYISIFFQKPQDKFAVMVDDEVRVYEIKTGKLLYSKKTNAENDFHIWGENFTQFTLWKLLQSQDYFEVHDIDKDKATQIKHFLREVEIAVVPLGKYCLAGEYDEFILYNIESGNRLLKWQRSTPKGITVQDNAYEVKDTEFLVHDLKNQKPLILEKHDGYKPEPYRSKTLIVLPQKDHKSIYICNVDTLKELKKDLDQTIIATVLDSQERLLATGHDKKVNIFETATLKLVKTIEVEGSAQKMQYSKDGKFFVVYLSEFPDTLYVYDVARDYALLKVVGFKDPLVRNDWYETLVDFDDNSSVLGVKTTKEMITFIAQ